MDFVRTPESRFENLPDYPFAPQYVSDLKGYAPLRMHYLDEGNPRASEVFLCLHGQPTWSFLYRKMIPIFMAAGHRVVCPDLFGFGKSDKPIHESTYTFEWHRASLLRFIEHLNLKNITLVCQDWGGVLGLTLPMAMPTRFKRLLIMNTSLATGDVPLTEGFKLWRSYCCSTPNMNVGALLARSCPGKLTREEALAYEAPFPDLTFKAGVRIFPALVPENLNDLGAATSRKAREWLRTQWEGESFMVVGELDPVLGLPVMAKLRKFIRGCPEPFVLPHAGHFVQEWGDEVARAALAHFARSKGQSKL